MSLDHPTRRVSKAPQPPPPPVPSALLDPTGSNKTGNHPLPGQTCDDAHRSHASTAFFSHRGSRIATICVLVAIMGSVAIGGVVSVVAINTADNESNRTVGGGLTLADADQPPSATASDPIDAGSFNADDSLPSPPLVDEDRLSEPTVPTTDSVASEPIKRVNPFDVPERSIAAEHVAQSDREPIDGENDVAIIDQSKLDDPQRQSPWPIDPEVEIFLARVDPESLKQMLVNDVSELSFFRTDEEARDVISQYQTSRRRQRQGRIRQTSRIQPNRELDGEGEEEASFDNMAYISRRQDLQGIPFIMGDECHIDDDFASVIAQISVEFGSLRTRQARSRVTAEQMETIRERQREVLIASGQFTEDQLEAQLDMMNAHLSIDGHRQALLDLLDGMKGSRFAPRKMVSSIVQLLQADDVPMRLGMVDLLAEINCSESTEALANIACFDLDQSVREAATEVLYERDEMDYKDTLLTNLWYPWEPVSINAAETLVQVGRGWSESAGLMDDLSGMLDRPNPQAPHQVDDGRWVVQEMVKVNHMRNCMMCHDTQTTEFVSADDQQIPGLVPTPGQSIPVQYYQSSSGTFVDASTTYLRQDFSITHHVEDHGRWPEQQRFDFFVRERELAPHEIDQIKEAELANQPLGVDERFVSIVDESSFVQRNATLYVMQELRREEGDPTPIEIMSERARIQNVKEMLNID